MEDQRHRLELALSESQRENNDITVQLQSCEGRLSEMQSLVSRLEESKKVLEAKLSSACSTVLKDIKTSRPSTPSRARSSSLRRSELLRSSAGDEVDSIKNGVKELLHKITDVESERDNIHEELLEVRRKRDELAVKNMELERKLRKQKEDLAGSEEQLRKLEKKVSISDIALANQVRSVRLCQMKLSHSSP